MQLKHSNVFPEVLIIEPRRFHDDRGYFFETFNARRYQDAGILPAFVQDNFSFSIKHTLHGLQYQRNHPQGKLVGVTSGKVFDVMVDIRENSPTFRQHDIIELSAETGRQVYIPPGFAHGFYVISDTAGFYYKCTDFYDAADDCGILWNDKKLAIEWPLEGNPLLSAKDLGYSPL